VRAAETQGLDDDSAPVTLTRIAEEEPKSSEFIRRFWCPWCNKAYVVNAKGMNVIFRCIKCNKVGWVDAAS